MPARVHVTALSGNVLCTIDLQEGDCLAELRAAIEKATQIDADEQRLFRGAEELRSDTSLAAVAAAAEAVNLVLVQTFQDDTGTLLPLRREVRAILSDAADVSLAEVVSRLARLNVTTTEELTNLANIFVKVALAQPSGGETYANIAQRLIQGRVLPSFKAEDGSQLNFARLLLSSLQESFEELGPFRLPNREEEVVQKSARQMERAVAHAQLLCHLFNRRLFSLGVISQVLWQLIGPPGRPTPLSLEYVHVFLCLIDKRLVQHEQVQKLIEKVVTRLVALSTASDEAASHSESVLGKIQCCLIAAA